MKEKNAVLIVRISCLAAALALCTLIFLSSPRHMEADTSEHMSFTQLEEFLVQNIGEGFIRKIKITASSLRTTYDIEFWYDGWEYELQMDAASGELIEYKLDRSVEHILARRSPLPQARISFEQAREIAQEQKGGGIRSLELDFYRGNWIYRATLGQGRRSWSLKFDAVTGETVTFWDWRSAQ